MIVMVPVAPGAAARADAKAYLRIAGADEDALLDRMLGTAAELCEQFTGQVLLRRTAVETLPAGPGWTRLGRTPVAAITLVEGLGADGTAAALAADAYAVDIDANGDGWVRLARADAARRLRVTYEAGLATEWAGLPEALRQGTVRLAAHLYANRDGARAEGPPAAVTALWRPWRRIRIG
jgi:uncharacterized phiE125 gp8 family phage protein